ncbi:MAG TPA: EamA family transporter [Candidatus Dormibacteraeota bacterium]|nr:EamA family transporter [Candidatus Dormibacteraeota bacterium]
MVGKGTLNAIGPLSTALLRFTGASIALLLVHFLRPQRERVARRDIPKILLLGFLVVPVNQGFFLFGLTQSTASHAALLYALTPAVVFLLARRYLKEGNAKEKLIGIVVAFTGVALILLDRGLARETGVLRGDLLMLIAVFSWAVYTISSKDLLRRYDPMTLTTWVLVSGTLMCLPAALIPHAIPPLRSLTLPVWSGIFYLAVGTSVIAYPLWLYALRHLEASKVAITTNAQPVLTSFLSWILFRERFGPAFFVGAALILFGVSWVETRKGGVLPMGGQKQPLPGS